MLIRRLELAAVLVAGLFLFGCQPDPSQAKDPANKNSAAAGKVDPKVVEEVKALLAAHDKALNDQSLDGVIGTFSTDPKVVLLGTGEGERFVGTEAIRSAYTEIFKDYEKGTFVANCDWKTGDADSTATMAWMAATCTETDSMKGVKRNFVLNISAAAVKQDTGWRFVMLHMSNAPSPGPPSDAKKSEQKKPEAAKPEANKPEVKKQ